MKPLYQSTRSDSQGVEARQAVVQGICGDGGLFVWPQLDQASVDLDEICSGDYRSIARTVFHTLLSGYTPEEIDACIAGAYDGTFDGSDDTITPLKTVGDIEVLELFRGPTSAFKDVALTMLPQLLSCALKTSGQKAMILTATSGDTGKAAMAGFQDVPSTGICVFYPHGKVSDIQYRQMACQPGDNVRVFAIEGNFDDAQSMVKKLFLDPELNERLAKKGISLSSANSINIGRLIPQIVYYFDAYRQLVVKNAIQKGEKISFSVPTGNFGDVLAGYYAYLLGLPVKKFYVASNANDVLSEFLATGCYDRRRPFIQTISPSMDILISSNLERLLYYASGKDSAKVAGWMEQLAAEGFYQLDETTFRTISDLFEGGAFDDDALRQIIGDTYRKTGYVLDPHTAAAYGLAGKADGVVVALSTASPYKFSADVLEALGKSSDDPWQAMKDLETLSGEAVPAGLAALPEAEILHTVVLRPEEMKEAAAKAALEIFE